VPIAQKAIGELEQKVTELDKPVNFGSVGNNEVYKELMEECQKL
jgi:hypothetical protein